MPSKNRKAKKAGPPPDLGEPLDPNFPDYVYAAKPLVDSFDRPGGKKLATMMCGEWMKVRQDCSHRKGWLGVAYRGEKAAYVRIGDVSRRRWLEVFFIDVGQGDAVLIQTPDDRRILVDGGKTDDALDFIINKYRLDKPDNYIDFEAVVATHCDADHMAGLIPILTHPKIAVKRVFHNGLFRRTDPRQDPGPRADKCVGGLLEDPRESSGPPLKRDMVHFANALDAAEANLKKALGEMSKQKRWKGRMEAPRRMVVHRLEASDHFLPPYDGGNPHLQIKVLWPLAEKRNGTPTYPWYGSPGETVNGNSLVLKLVCGRYRLLLTGDLNDKAMPALLNLYGRELASDVCKAAHHGSQHFTVDFLRAVAADAVVISSGDDRLDCHGHPRAVLLGTATRHARCDEPAVFCTELAACYSKLEGESRENFRAGTGRLYERAIQGIVHLRCNGEKLYLGTVLGRRPPKDPFAQTTWKWDIWPKGDDPQD